MLPAEAWSPGQRASLQMPNTTTVPRDMCQRSQAEDNRQHRDPTVITARPAGLPPAEPACLPSLSEVSPPARAQTPGCSCGWVPGSFILPPAPSPGLAKPAAKTKGIRQLEPRGRGEAGPSGGLKGPISHPPATSRIQTPGEGQGQDRWDPSYGEGESEEKGVCSLVPCGKQPQTQRKAQSRGGAGDTPWGAATQAPWDPQDVGWLKDRPSKRSQKKRTASTRSHTP